MNRGAFFLLEVPTWDAASGVLAVEADRTSPDQVVDGPGFVISDRVPRICDPRSNVQLRLVSANLSQLRIA